MNAKIVTVLTVLIVLCGYYGQVYGASNDIELQVFDQSNRFWIAVQPKHDSGLTRKIEIQEGSSSTWTEMTLVEGWVFYDVQSHSGSGFVFPLSFRLTSTSGQQVVAKDLLNSITVGVVNTGVQFGTSTTAPTTAPTHTPAPTQAPTHTPAPTQAPTHTPAPTQAPTHTPAPTQAPTQAPTHTPAPTQAPTHTPAPTQAPTHTPAPTQAPTHTPAPTQAPTRAPTPAPTQAPTRAPTQAPTRAPTQPPSSTSLCGITPTSEEPLKILVPLYVEPGSAWTELITAAATGVKIVAIINPNSGPGNGPDSSYTSFMQQFTEAGITMVGYVHTTFGARAISDVTADINTWATKFTGVSGIFIDECSASSTEISYYTQVFDAITAVPGYTNTILNPGTAPDEGYMAISTNIIMFEDVGSNFKSNFPTWATCAPNSSEKSGYKYRFGAIGHNVPSGSVSSTLSSFMNAGMGLVYVTDGSDYNNLASYFATESSDVKSLN